MNSYKIEPSKIEAMSFEIIEREAGPHGWTPFQWSVVRRLVHASADFDYVRDLFISPGAVEAGVAALKEGARIITDTNMCATGINISRKGLLSNKVECLIEREEVKKAAAESSLTRAMGAVDIALIETKSFGPGTIWVFGNAPTALFRLLERLSADPLLNRPRLVVGLPVGFVNALESKMALKQSNLSYFITNLSRKGGSNVAAAAVNALAALAVEGQGA
ncbi:MAG: precorrin-8X methylmutase [Deltaproteobacteria bacterium]|jgi:precorrin-8X/cobalt-precorrin-8 methylmutase|nr:precorrin-8X methylmutase [Deltaproteobacteria bacterium]